MFRSHVVRMSIAAAAAVAIPLGGAVAFSAGNAGASFVGIKCSTMSGNVNNTINVTGCNGNTGGSTTLTAATLASGGTIIWANSDTTTIAAPAVNQVTTGVTCLVNKNVSEYSAKGMVTADTTGSAPVPGNYKIFFCLNSKTGAITNTPGKKIKIG